MKTNFKITNLVCDACVKISAAALRELPGVKSVEIGKDGSASLESDKEINWEEIENALANVDKRVSFK